MSKNMEYQLNIGSNQDIASASFLTLHDEKIEESLQTRYNYKHII